MKTQQHGHSSSGLDGVDIGSYGGWTLDALDNIVPEVVWRLARKDILMELCLRFLLIGTLFTLVSSLLLHHLS